MKIKIYHKYGGRQFCVFVEGNDGWYRTYYRYFTNPNQISHKLKKKKLSIKYITKLFRKMYIEYNGLDLNQDLEQHIKTGNMTHIVSYEIKK